MACAQRCRARHLKRVPPNNRMQLSARGLWSANISDRRPSEPRSATLMASRRAAGRCMVASRRAAADAQAVGQHEELKVLARTLNRLRSSRIGARREGVFSAIQVVAWWEARRLVFNACVGVAGVASLLFVSAVALLSEKLVGEPFGLPDPVGLVLLGVAAYALAANALYTGGWIVELIARRVRPTEAPMFGTAMFSLGLVASVLLTLLLGALLGLVGIGSLAFALFSRPVG